MCARSRRRGRGDSGFRHGFDAVFPQAVRTEYADDIVPHLPPELVLVSALRKIPRFQGIRLPSDGFVSAGTLAYYPRGSSTATVPDSGSWTGSESPVWSTRWCMANST